jgi:hypothetical protein
MLNSTPTAAVAAIKAAAVIWILNAILTMQSAADSSAMRFMLFG